MVKNFPIKVKCPKCGQMFIAGTNCVFCVCPYPILPLKDKMLPKGEPTEIDGRNVV